MRAITYAHFGAPLQLERVQDPEPPLHGAVLRVHATGLCRSDWHGWQGHDTDIRTFPHVPGHELAGTIAAVGHDVHRWHVGDRVTVPFVCACGTCVPCARGDGQVCDAQTQPGFTHWGSYAEFVRIDHADVNLVSLPETIDFDTAAGLGCRVATAFRAVVDQGRVHEGDTIAVFGCGGVGLAAVMVAQAHGARVIAVDVSDAALTLAASLGAELTLNARNVSDVASHIQEYTRGGADSAYDALGSADTARGALMSLRKNGRYVQIGLLGGIEAEPRLPLHLLIARELEIVGSHGMAAHAYPRMLRMVERGELDVSRLITRRIPLEDAPNALSTMVALPHAGMTIIVP